MGHDLSFYWPLKWLPADPDIQQARIFTFGYNADFRSSCQSANLGISDFSKTLLYDMAYGRDLTGETFGFGKVSPCSVMMVLSRAKSQSVPSYSSPIQWAV